MKPVFSKLSLSLALAVSTTFGASYPIAFAADAPPAGESTATKETMEKLRSAADAVNDAADAVKTHIETAPASTTSTTTAAATGEYAVESDDKDHEAERKELQGVIAAIEAQWNKHDLAGYMSNYADDYVSNDGFDKRATQSLTEEFWKTYPDARSVSKIKNIRIEGNYATVSSRDTGTATTEMANMPDKGELQSVSEGQQYLRRFGTTWKIIGDRIDFEKVKVAFSLAKHLNSSFIAPEQVKGGKQYSARLEATLPPGFRAMGSISNQVLKFPQPAPAEKPRMLDSTAVLERVMPANTENHNELLTGTIILVNPAGKIMGICFLTRRLNVVPETHDVSEVQTAQVQADSHTK